MTDRRAPAGGSVPAPLMLASVTSVAEARLAQTLGSDVIDCKNPLRGALGALPLEIVAAIRQAIPESVLSATIGDVALSPEVVPVLVTATAQTGVDFVKIGIFPGGNPSATLDQLAALPRARLGHARLVGVLLADRGLNLDTIDALAAAGFAGVMLDTEGKGSRALPDLLSPATLRDFLARARHSGLFTGLAGSLRAAHIAPLASLAPDILGFRGALCTDLDRRAALDPLRVTQIRALLPRSSRSPALHLAPLSMSERVS